MMSCRPAGCEGPILPWSEYMNSETTLKPLPTAHKCGHHASSIKM